MEPNRNVKIIALLTQGSKRSIVFDKTENTKPCYN